MKPKKTTLLRPGLAVAWWGAALVAQAVSTTDFSRYQVVLDRKPFGEVAPIVVPGAVDQATAESFAKDYEMKAIIDDGDKIQVCVLDKQNKKHIYLDIGREVSGMQLVSVNYDKEEAVLKIGTDTTIIKLHPDKDKGAVPAMARAAPFGGPQPNLSTENAMPFGPSKQETDKRRPFFSDMKRRGTSPFRRMGTNAPFQAKSLESFFKPNTNTTTPFVSPFRPQASPFKPVNTPGAVGQDSSNPAFPFAPANPSAQEGGSGGLSPQMPATPIQGYSQPPPQPAMMPFTAPVEYDETGESEE